MPCEIICRLRGWQWELSTNGSRPLSRVLCPRCGLPRPRRQPFLWAVTYVTALATYPQASAEPACSARDFVHTALAYLVLLRMEVAAFHPPVSRGLVSVALFVTSPCQGVTLHPALRSPDFPLWSNERHSGCLADSRCNFTAAGGAYEVQQRFQEVAHAQTSLLSSSRCRKRAPHGRRPAARARRRPPHALSRQARHRSCRAARGRLSHQDRFPARCRRRPRPGHARRRGARRADRAQPDRGNAAAPAVVLRHAAGRRAA